MRSNDCGSPWTYLLALAPLLPAPEWKRDGAFSFPQAEATVLCDREELRVSAWNDSTFLYVQAVVFVDGDDALGETKDGRKIGDWSELVFDVDGDGKPTPKLDRGYTLNPWPSMPGLHYQEVVDAEARTGLKDNSLGRGAIAYLPLENGTRARVDSFLIPLVELGRKAGDSLRVAYWCSSAKPEMKLNSIGFQGENAQTTHDLPRKDFHTVTLADRGKTIEPKYVPEGRATSESVAASLAATNEPPIIQPRKPEVDPKRGLVASGQPPPEVAAADWIRWTGAEPPTLKSLAGKVVVVEFWATWCRPCVQGIPHLNELQEKYADKGLVILSLTNQPKKVVEEFQANQAMKYVVGTGSETGMAYGVRGIPAAYVVGRDGKLAWYGHPADEAFDATIRDLIAKK